MAFKGLIGNLITRLKGQFAPQPEKLLPQGMAAKVARQRRQALSPQFQIEMSQRKLRTELQKETRSIRRALLKVEAAARELIPRVKMAVAKAFGGLGLFGVGEEPIAKDQIVAPKRGPMKDVVRPETPAKQAPMIGVSSSNVYSVGYEPHTDDETGAELDVGTLYIQFRNGWLYHYKDAPRWLYEGLLRAPSPGRYVWDFIRRGLYPDGIPYGDLDIWGYERIS